MYIKISVNNKIATVQDNVQIINGNSDYVIKFDFDAEWDAYETKTARFVTARGYTDVVFSGDEVALPVITDAISVRVGVYAGNLHTTTPAVIFCRRCITDGSGSPADPAPDVYAQIMERLNNLDGVNPATTDKLGVVKIGDNLKITKDGVLSVDTADAAAQDNTRPITSAAVYTAKSNIEALLGNLNDLTTGAKNNLVAAINEAAQTGGGGGSAVALDTTLTQSGKAADAKAVGDRLSSLSEEIANKAANVYIGPVQPTDGTLYWLDTSESGGSGGETVTYSITADLTNVTIDNTAGSANEGESFAAAITVSDGYELSSVKITMGGADITNTAYASGNIYISAVTGDVVITAVAVKVSGEVTTYTITNNLVNVTSDNSAVFVEENAAYTATLTATAGYTLDAVTVTMGGANVTDSVYADGVITIPAVTGNVVITATSIEGVWKAVGVTNMPSATLNWYSDDGTTLIVTTAKASSHTAVFDTETEVKIALVLNATQYATFYVGMNTADDNRNGYYAEDFGISGYPQAGTTYERTFTVKAGYALMVGGWNNPSAIESLTVLKKG